jgi:transposase
MQTIGFAGGIDTLYKTAARYGIKVVACNECYTSRECSCCRDCDFRSKTRTFTCSSCGLISHRDAGNSTVNIFIRALALGLDVNQALHNLTASHDAGYVFDDGGEGEDNTN